MDASPTMRTRHKHAHRSSGPLRAGMTGTPLAVVHAAVAVAAVAALCGVLPGALAQCPSGWVAQTFGSPKCFKLVETHMPQAQANDNCQALDSRAHLASLHSEQEHNYVRGMIAEPSWIGVYDLGGDNWAWRDGTSLDFTMWPFDLFGCACYRAPTSSNCARVSDSVFDDRWGGASCSTYLTSVCQLSLCPDGYDCSSGSEAPCGAGYFCVNGQKTLIPAGQYGVGGTATTRSSATDCDEPGFYCSGGAKLGCPAGRYGSVASTSFTTTCEGACTAGYMCQPGSASATQAACSTSAGGNDVYCPAGAQAPQLVGIGFYAAGGDAHHRTGQTKCEEGNFCVDGVKAQCPAGTFGSAQGLTSAACSGNCAPGYLCPAGSTSAVAHKCGDGASAPATRYCPDPAGSAMTVGAGQYSTPTTASVDTRSGAADCEAGAWCSDGLKNLCGSGFGSAALKATSSDTCEKCQPGYYCPAGSPSTTAHNCGFNSYCPEGVGSPIPVTAGYRQSVPGVNSPGQLECEPGFYCVQGERHSCPPGRYQNRGGGTEVTCAGPCSAGYYCPAGSTSATMYSCGSPEKYCPLGGGVTASGAPLSVPVGHYSIGGSSSSTRVDAAPCLDGHFCSAGVITPCPVGTWGNNALDGPLTSVDHCTACDDGFVCNAASTAPFASPCLSTVPQVFCSAGVSYLVGSGNYSVSATVVISDDGTEAKVNVREAPCGAGYKCQNGLSVPCPAGTYNPDVGMRECTGTCPAGFYCPQGTGTPIKCGGVHLACPAGSAAPLSATAGTYTAPVSAPSNERQAIVPCPAGAYCPGDGLLYACPPGKFSTAVGPSGATSEAVCTPCRPGCACPGAELQVIGVAGSSSECEVGCTDAQHFCPEQSPKPSLVGSGYYSSVKDGFSALQPDGTTLYYRDVQTKCRPGHFCTGGVMKQCEPGTWEDKEGQSACRGICPAGFVCGPGASIPDRTPCDDPRFHCPAGSGEVVTSVLGYHGVGEVVQNPDGDDVEVFVGVGLCGAGHWCEGGEAAPCPAGRYAGFVGRGTDWCDGACDPGAHCTEGAVSGSPASSPCGGEVYVCAAGQPRAWVPVGYFSVDVALATELAAAGGTGVAMSGAPVADTVPADGASAPTPTLELLDMTAGEASDFAGSEDDECGVGGTRAAVFAPFEGASALQEALAPDTEGDARALAFPTPPRLPFGGLLSFRFRFFDPADETASVDCAGGDGSDGTSAVAVEVGGVATLVLRPPSDPHAASLLASPNPNGSGPGWHNVTVQIPAHPHWSTTAVSPGDRSDGSVSIRWVQHGVAGAEPVPWAVDAVSLTPYVAVLSGTAGTAADASAGGGAGAGTRRGGMMPCGSPELYCSGGVRREAGPSYYTTSTREDDDGSTRDAMHECAAGSYCTGDGSLLPCPVGSSCLAGASEPDASQCQLPAYYCPGGQPVAVDNGYVPVDGVVGEGGEGEPPEVAHVDQAPCGSAEYYCVNGTRWPTQSGHASAGGADAGTHWYQEPCGSPAFVCSGGVRSPVPDGYRASGGVTDDVHSSALPCDDPAHLCLGGLAIATGLGFYATPAVDGAPKTGQQVCPRGHFCGAAVPLVRPGGVATPCPAGTYLDAEGATSEAACVLCAAGTASGDEGATSALACVACVAPEWSEAGAAACWPGVTAVSAQEGTLFATAPGISAGDELLVEFTRAVGVAAGDAGGAELRPLTSQEVAALLQFSTPVAPTFTSRWEGGGTRLVVTMLDVHSSAAYDASDSAVGTLQVGVCPDCEANRTPVRLVSLGGRSQAIRTAAPVTVGGSWGRWHPPTIAVAAAADDGASQALLSNGDTLTVTFDQAVSTPLLANTADVDKVFTFSAPIGQAYSGHWVGVNTAVITITAGRAAADVTDAWIAAVAVGELTVRLRGDVAGAVGVTSRDRSSLPSTDVAIVDVGTWGDAPSALALFVHSASSLLAVFTTPETAGGYAVGHYLVQWTADPAGAFDNGVPRSTLNVTAPGAAVVPANAAAGGAQHSFVIDGLQTGVEVHVRVAADNKGAYVHKSFGATGARFGPWKRPDGVQSLAPRAPTITSVSGGRFMATTGGEAVVLVGHAFGNVLGDNVVTATYSNAQGRTYTAVDCVVVGNSGTADGGGGDLSSSSGSGSGGGSADGNNSTAPTSAEAAAAQLLAAASSGLGRIRCTSAEGVGVGFHWTVTVNGFTSAPSPTTTSYAPPTVSGFVGDARADADTRGGQTLTINGNNFGRAEDSGLDSVTYTAEGLAQVFVAADGALASSQGGEAPTCWVSTPHVAVTCFTVPGAGANLRWVVTIAGQASVAPSSAYAVPVITDVRRLDGGSVTALSTLGGQDIEIVGDFFGPASPNLISRVTYGPTGVEYAAVGCQVTTAHTVIRCATAEGAGQGHGWIVSVHGQPSPLSEVATAYAPPAVLAVSPPSLDTNGGSVFVLGRNFGATASAVRLQLGGVPYSAFALLDHETIGLAVQPGSGADVAVEVIVAGQRSEPAAYYSYNPPTVQSLDVLEISADGRALMNVLGTSLGSGDADAEQGYAPATVTVGGAECEVALQTHTEIQCWTEEWLGPVVVTVGGLRSVVVLRSGQQVSEITFDVMSFLERPAIDSVAVDSPAGDGLVPTAGGVNVTLSGSNFKDSADRVVSFVAVAPSAQAVAQGLHSLECVVVAWTPDEVVCRAPPAQGEFYIVVAVGMTVSPAQSVRIDYAPPAVAAVVPAVVPTSSSNVTVVGDNFGFFGSVLVEVVPASNLAIVAAAGAGGDGSGGSGSGTGVGVAAAGGSGSDAGAGAGGGSGGFGECKVTSWSHTAINCTLPAGTSAAADVTVHVAGRASAPVPIARPPPAIASVAPATLDMSSVDDVVLINISGTNFGPAGGVYDAGASVSGSSGSSSEAPLVAITVGGRRCALVAVAHTSATCRAPLGVGAGQEVVVYNAHQSSAAAPSHGPPVTKVSYAAPLIAAVEVPSGSAPAVGGFPVTIRGRGFGVDGLGGGIAVTVRLAPEAAAAGAATGSAGAAVVPCAVTSRSADTVVCTAPPGVGGHVALTLTTPVGAGAQSTTRADAFAYDAPVVTSVRPNVGDALLGTPGAVVSGRNFGPYKPRHLAVDSGGDACTNVVWISDREVRCDTQPDAVVGNRSLTVVVANQTSAGFTTYVECKDGYFGVTGERCSGCPEGGVCPGGDTEPYPLPGYWRQERTVFLSCTPRVACPGGAESPCLVGYEGAACSSCGVGFYRLKEVCERCPDTAWILVLGFCLGIALMCALGVFANKKRINMAGAAIGVDYAQITSMVANFDFAWPPQLIELFNVVALSTADINIVAPECIGTWSFQMKFFLTQGLLLGIFGVCLAAWAVLRCALWARNPTLPSLRRASGRDTATLIRSFSTFTAGNSASDQATAAARERVATINDGLIGFAFSASYLLYFVEVKSALSVFDCNVNTNGLLTMDAEPSIECYAAGGTHQAMVPYAVASLLCYGLGIPVVFGAVVYKFRNQIKFDQHLRARGEGDSANSNPAFFVRRRYRRLYEDFKEDATWWRFVLLFRKFSLACVSLLFNRNPMFQSAVSVGVLFVSYVAHIKKQPFLPRASVSQTFIDMAKSAQEQDAARKRRTSVMVLSRAAAGSKTAQYTFDYNRLEGWLLISSVLLLLGGMIFESSAFEEGTTGYTVTAVLLVVMILMSTGGFVSMLVFEFYRSIKFSAVVERARKLEAESNASMHSHKAMVRRLQGRGDAGDDGDGASSGPGGGPGSAADDRRKSYTSSLAGRRMMASLDLELSAIGEEPAGTGTGGADASPTQTGGGWRSFKSKFVKRQDSGATRGRTASSAKANPLARMSPKGDAGDDAVAFNAVHSNPLFNRARQAEAAAATAVGAGGGESKERPEGALIAAGVPSHVAKAAHATRGVAATGKARGGVQGRIAKTRRVKGTRE